ncbi:MAG: 8, gp08 [Frankiales bacterium]|nr:8, gp08 [Frankiales bacterium]
MRAVTIQMPWAWAVAYNLKNPENRGRPDPWRSAQDAMLGIHAGKTWDYEALFDLRMQRALDVAFPNPDPMDRVHTWQQHLRDVVVPQLHELDGKLLSARRLIDVHGYRSLCTCDDWAEPGQFHLVFEPAVEFFEPTPCRGYQGLWTVPFDVAEIPRIALAGAR